MKQIVFTAVALALSTTMAAAHSNDARQAEQNAWIEQGRNNGSITWREGIKLRREQADIARIESEMKSDGRFTRSEKRALHNIQDQAQRDIAQEAHDSWYRPRWLRRFGF